MFQVELYINGAKSPQKNKKPIERPEDHVGLVFMLFFTNCTDCTSVNCELSQEAFGDPTWAQLLRQDSVNWKDS